VNKDHFYNVSYNKNISGLPDLNKKFIILGIETSCDDTAVGIVQSDGAILANIICSQHEIHKEFNGIVPILAMNSHKEKIRYAIAKALIVAFKSDSHMNITTTSVIEYMDVLFKDFETRICTGTDIGTNTFDGVSDMSTITNVNTNTNTNSTMTNGTLVSVQNLHNPNQNTLEHHDKHQYRILKDIFKQIDGIAVTKGPGLELCLRVGCQTAQVKTLLYMLI